MRNRFALLLALVACAVTPRADAALTLTLAPAAQNAAQGTQLALSGTLTNTSGTAKVFLNDLQATFTGGASAVLVLERNTFFANVPGILLPGETYTGVIFRLNLSPAAAGDYAGTIVVKGGVDMTAAGDLASAVFTVFSPTVGIVATDASASEFGPDSGTITITRTGSTALALPVPYSISGSALNGTTYAALSGLAVIAAGAASVAIPVTPLPDNLAQGDRVATLSLAASPAFNPGTALTASVTIHDKPADQWRLEKFGAAANDPEAQDLADWERDGIKNLVEYSLDLDPKAASLQALPQSGSIGGYATFSYVPNPAATDLTYTVEASADLVGWSTAHVESVSVVNPIPLNRVTVRYDVPISSSNEIFFRLKVTRLGVSP